MVALDLWLSTWTLFRIKLLMNTLKEIEMIRNKDKLVIDLRLLSNILELFGRKFQRDSNYTSPVLSH